MREEGAVSSMKLCTELKLCLYVSQDLKEPYRKLKESLIILKELNHSLEIRSLNPNTIWNWLMFDGS